MEPQEQLEKSYRLLLSKGYEISCTREVSYVISPTSYGWTPQVVDIVIRRCNNHKLTEEAKEVKKLMEMHNTLYGSHNL